MARPAAKPKLAALAGNEAILATSVAGGAKDGGGTVAAGADIHITPDQLLARSRQVNIVSTITSGHITPAGNTDLLRPAALTAALVVDNPSTTPVDGDGFMAYFFDNGTTRAITYGSMYADSAFATRLAATTAGKKHELGFEYSAADNKLYCKYARVEA